MEELKKALGAIQAELKAPKNQYNAFAKYHYRSCEDILEAVKPLLAKNNATLTITDEPVEVGGRVYIRATCEFSVANSEEEIVVSAYARESESKKGMDDSQITGATSSYARKYALNGLFLIDDARDADTQPPVKDERKSTVSANEIVSEVNKKTTIEQLNRYFSDLRTAGVDVENVKATFSRRKSEILGEA